MSRVERVKKHFDGEAEKFDGIILKNVPYYDEMTDILVNHLIFKKTKNLKIIDIGCGTGNIACKIKKQFPRAKIKCVDIAEKMIKIAGKKLSSFSGIEFEIADFAKFEFSEKYDAVVSSLALHHIDSDKTKIAFYEKIYRALKKGGIFINADIVLSSSPFFQQENMKNWERFLLKSYNIRHVRKMWLARYKDEDRPASLLLQLEWLRKIGFKDVDVFWKYYNFSVYGGRKR
jgi:tRNA (cmo5U34)-methyltransferase